MSTEKRAKGASVTKSIAYGNIAFSLGKKAEEGKTHKWVAYVRGAKNEDISYYVKKVVFVLHPSFPNPKRVVERFPFEISETGWGEFEITIKIFFHDVSEKPIDIFHFLRLFNPSEGPNINPKKPVVTEFYDELVFNSPKEEYYAILTQFGDDTPPPIHTKYSEFYGTYDEEPELKKLTDISKKLKAELLQTQQKYNSLESEYNQFSLEIQSLEASNNSKLLRL